MAHDCSHQATIKIYRKDNKINDLIFGWTLNHQQRKELEAIVRSPRQDHGVARRANAILLLDDGWSCQETGAAFYLDDDTIRHWYKQYLKVGVDLLTMFDWKGGHSRMSMAQQAQLCEWLEGRFCRSTDEIRAFMFSEFGLHYSHSGCIKLLGRLGFEYRFRALLMLISVNERTKLTRFEHFKLTHSMWRKAPIRAALKYRVRLGALLAERLRFPAAFVLREAV